MESRPTSRPSSPTVSRIAQAQRIARAGPSKRAKKPSAVSSSTPLKRTSWLRILFQGMTEAVAYQAMLRAAPASWRRSRTTTHTIRHSRITIWHQSGVPARELAERAGHARPSMSLDVYSHVMPADELPIERFSALIER